MHQSDYWNDIYRNIAHRAPNYDGWLDKHMSTLRLAEKIIDLGCGSGTDTIELRKNDIKVISCDKSEFALLKLQEYIPDAQVACFDMANGLPFESGSIDVVIADLSLHYFDLQTTKRICLDICRVLNINGVLFSRVNSIKEYIPDISDIKLEDNYYFTKGYSRRFFSPDDIYQIFGTYFRIDCIIESVSKRYFGKKHLVEFTAVKNHIKTI